MQRLGANEINVRALEERQNFPHLRRGNVDATRFQTFHVWLPSPRRSRGQKGIF
ncbi:MAG TPA: hypothetical protein VF791_06840 [Pyrinomonadaceae bacterium]